METWREIVAEMRRGPCSWILPDFIDQMNNDNDHFKRFADRIEAACKTLEDLLIVEQDENAKLRRALEPVMKCWIGGACLDGAWQAGHDAVIAVREAQAIMKEGAE